MSVNLQPNTQPQGQRNSNLFNIRIGYSNIPRPPDAAPVDTLEVSPDNTFNDILGTLHEKGIVDPLPRQAVRNVDGRSIYKTYVFKHITSDGAGRFVQDNSQKLSEYSVKPNDELKLIIKEQMA